MKKSYLMIHVSNKLPKDISQKIKNKYPLSDIMFEGNIECEEFNVFAEDENPEYEEKAREDVKNIIQIACKTIKP